MKLQPKQKVSYPDEYYKKDDTIDSYTIQELLGEGRYGIVYLAVDGEGNNYVVKQLKKKMIYRRSKDFYNEELCLRTLHHTSFPRFISSFHDMDKEGYILEYIEGQVFEDIVRKERYQFSRDEIYMVCGQLLDLLEILHSNHIIHGDIRLPNVIRRNNGELSLVDFGLAGFMDHKKYTKEIDYWYLGDFLVHLYYTTYHEGSKIERPWFKELALRPDERVFLKRLMGIDKTYDNIHEIRQELNTIKES